MIGFRTASGQRLDLEHLHPDQITLEDLARGLSHACRFTGQLSVFYSVAQHCVLVADLLPAHLRPHGLLHDASEAFICDLPRNLKHHPLLAGYRAIEVHVQNAIERRFHLRPLTETERWRLKVADDLAALVERALFQEQRPFDAMDIRRIEDPAKRQEALDLARGLPARWDPWPATTAYDLWVRLVTQEMRKARAPLN